MWLLSQGQFDLMKVGILIFPPYRESLGSFRRIHDLTRGLKEIGVDPIIITPFGGTAQIHDMNVKKMPLLFPGLRIGEQFYKFFKDLINHRIFLGLFIRSLNRVKIGSAAVNYIRALDLDILQIEEEPVAMMALPLVKELSIPLVFDLSGIWADELVDSGVITTQNVEYRMIQEMTRSAVLQMDAVLVMSKEMKEYVAREYSAKPETIHILEMGTRPKIQNIPKRDRPTKVIYAGQLSKAKHAELFLNSIPYIVERDPDTIFYITKKGDMVNQALKIGKEIGAKIETFWFDEEEHLFEFMSRCHVGVLTLPDNLSYRTNPAAKFYDYMSVGLPVVANDIGGWIKIVEEDSVGILTDDDPIDFAKGVLRLAHEPDLALEYSKKCLETSKKKYSLEAAIAELPAFYRGLLKKKVIAS